MVAMLGRKALVATVLAAATLVACGGDSPTPPPTPVPSETATAPPPTATSTTAPSPTPATTPATTPQPTPTQVPTATPSPTSASTPVASPTPTPTPDEPVDPVEQDPTPAVRPSLPQSPTFDAPPGVYTAITVGAGHACALTEDGEAVCWDIESAEVWDTPPGSYTFIDAVGAATCAITDEGEIVCWSAGGGLFSEDSLDPSRDAPPRWVHRVQLGHQLSRWAERRRGLRLCIDRKRGDRLLGFGGLACALGGTCSS